MTSATPDSLPVKKAHPGQRRHGGPRCLSPDSRAGPQGGDGLVAALGLAGGLAAEAATSASHVPSRPAASAAASRQTEQAARARPSLLLYLRKSRPLADLVPA
jgi:hypothetical protein